MTRIIERLDEISAPYDVLLCDLWGCVHDGVRPFPEAVAALQRFRAAGGTVILVTNAPRQRSAVQAHLEEMGLPRDAWDDIASSGDAARAAMYRGAAGEKVFFVGEAQDEVFFEPMALVENPVEITRVPLADAEGIVCTGPFDPLADPADLRPQLLYAKQKGLKLLCANPDIVVDRGDVREWCAGAVAALYTEMGGESLYFGKPHPAIYDLARARLSALGKSADTARILAVGDGIRTDIQGAQGEDMDALFITGGLAAQETDTDRQPDQAALDAFIAKEMVTPTFASGFLR
jgi:HAD superfamily hydrolase (TIGR01459 family)